MVHDGVVEVLATLTFTGAEAAYQPDPVYVVWAYAVPRNPQLLTLAFESGEVIDLMPLLP